ncbi:MAG: prepilin-type N-terminal cleavage/methylation domain-containing protein [Phycisphaerales bacterium]|nr:prepilin-type N-terminal cleavage/methylation domain-containing protein [Phycisphaerales bacterium]
MSDGAIGPIDTRRVMMLYSQTSPSPRSRRAFTLIELLVVIAVIALLIAILLPALGKAKDSGRQTVCLTQLKQLQLGWDLYADANQDAIVPGRAPDLPGGKSNAANWYEIGNGKKFRPTWISRMGQYVGIYPFAEPADASRADYNRQDYDNKFFQCPVAADWKDERNHCYGYNYLFLGNSRVTNSKFHNFPVRRAKVQTFDRTVVAADSMGTAASFAESDRTQYENDGRTETAYGNEAFSIDPPRLTAESDRASFPVRNAPHARHSKKVNVTFADSHAKVLSLDELGYAMEPDGRFVDADDKTRVNNSLFSGTGVDDDPPPIPN